MGVNKVSLGLILLGVAVICLFSAPASVQAQEGNTATCEAFVQQVLNDISLECAGMSRNTACYGNPEINYTRFSQDYGPDYFSQPGDRADLTTTQTIQTAPYNASTGTWGVSVFSLQANLPNELPGNGVVFIALGGVEVENGVEPGEAVILPLQGTPIATTTVGAQLLVDPPGAGKQEVITPIPRGTILSADALNAAGDYVRVIYQNNVGWVSRDVLDQSIDLSGLPRIGANSFTPMQSFYFRVGIGGTIPCADAPSLLFVQGPIETPVDITVHQQPIRVEGSAVLRTLPPGDELGNAMEVISLFGLVRIFPGTPNEIIIPPGFQAQIGFCPEFVSLGIEGDDDEKGVCGNWSTPRPLTQDELDELEIIGDFPENIINFPVDVPVIVIPSGIGAPPQTFQFPDPRALQRARELCLAGELPQSVCQFFGL